ncbi:MAG: hypothetical protein HY687_05835 [Chloroflexi bacterium]|nr:hypothetical protein [Chloroflexota bacterium]
MRQTGLFLLHLDGRRLSHFPAELTELLERDNIHFYEAFHEVSAPSQELLQRVHTSRLIAAVRQTPYYETALYSTGGTVLAAEEIARGRIHNAFVFTGSGDHHAGRDFFFGGCHFNGAALAVAHLRAQFGGRRFAILDTDAHHGDGTRDIFERDEDLLHVCLCGQSRDGGSKVDVAIPGHTTDAEYLERLEQALLPRMRQFRPETLFWEFGYDGTQGDYSDRGLTRDCHARIAALAKAAAEEVCGGRLVAILCGGSRQDLADYTIPRIIRILAELR